MDEVAPQPEQVEMTVGQQLRTARETQGKSLGDIAASLRISERMLDALERDAFSELPTGPYATGFARSYANALGLDPSSIVAAVRSAKGTQPVETGFAASQYEPMDVGRVPSRALAWTAAGIALAMVIAYLVWKSAILQPDSPEAATDSETPSAAAPSAAAPSGDAPATTAPPPVVADDVVVRIAASSQVWFSLEDSSGRSQFDLTLQGGEFYTLKPEQRGLLLRTGRPQALRILMGEDRLPQLGADDALVSDVRLDTASLAQRLRGQSTTAASTPALTPAINPNPPAARQTR